METSTIVLIAISLLANAASFIIGAIWGTQYKRKNHINFDVKQF
jgi:hypothetical protein